MIVADIIKSQVLSLTLGMLPWFCGSKFSILLFPFKGNMVNNVHQYGLNRFILFLDKIHALFS